MQVAVQNEKHPGSILMVVTRFILAILVPQTGLGVDVFSKSVDTGTCGLLLKVSSCTLISK